MSVEVDDGVDCEIRYRNGSCKCALGKSIVRKDRYTSRYGVDVEFLLLMATGKLCSDVWPYSL